MFLSKSFLQHARIGPELENRAYKTHIDFFFGFSPFPNRVMFLLCRQIAWCCDLSRPVQAVPGGRQVSCLAVLFPTTWARGRRPHSTFTAVSGEMVFSAIIHRLTYLKRAHGALRGLCDDMGAMPATPLASRGRRSLLTCAASRCKVHI